MTPDASTRPTSSRERRWVVALCVLPVALAGALAAFWVGTDRRQWPEGDEPHYLIMAASVLRDADLDLQNNYERDAETAEIYGPVQPHVFRFDHAWLPFHTPGLGVLLALPYGLGGVLLSRLLLCLSAGLLAWACWHWFRARGSPSAAAWLTSGVVMSVPVLYGASQIYPDLPGGVLITGLAVWLWAESGRRSRLAWATFWFLTGAVCWLHAKYLAPSAILACAGLWVGRRERPPDGPRPGYHLPVAALVLLGPLSLATYHYLTFGTALGLRGDELRSPWLRALEIFLGLHLDQAQGMFFQQPIFVLGLVGLGVLMRRRHPLTLPWLALYASAILPNAFEVARYGGGGPAGRFGWSGMWLWIIPIGVMLDVERSRFERYVRPIVVAGLAYQALLALAWIPRPLAMNPLLSEAVWERNSLFPVAARYSLPSFYFWESHGYLVYLPNVVWLLAAALLIVAGLAAGAVWTHRVRLAGVGLVVVAAMMLPVAPPSEHPTPPERARGMALLRSALSQSARRFEAERMTPMSVKGTARADPAASDGQARANRPTRGDNFIVFGPYIALDPGRYRVEFALRLGVPAEVEHAATCEVTASRGRQMLERIDVPVASLTADGRYTRIPVTFETAEPLDNVEFRVIANPEVDLLIDYIDLVPTLP